jgi:hypothetical protein
MSVHLMRSDDSDDNHIVVVGAATARTAAQLFALAPAASVVDLCGAICHLARGSDYRLIADPAVYNARYMNKYNSEDRSAPFAIGRLSDFGLADLAAIKAPQVEGGVATFFVEDDFLMIPYRVAARVDVEQPASEIEFEPVAMLPDPRDNEEQANK